MRSARAAEIMEELNKARSGAMIEREVAPGLNQGESDALQSRLGFKVGGTPSLKEARLTKKSSHQEQRSITFRL